MRHWLVLAGVYAAIVALVLPGSLTAQEEPPPAAPEAAPEEPQLEAAPSQPASPPPEPEPASPQPEPAAPAPAPAAPAPPEQAPPPPEQDLGDERSGAGRPEAVAVAAASTTVTISDFRFAPAQITIQEGDTVTWTNDGPTPHSSTSKNGVWDTGIFPEGQSRSHTFDEAGTFAYICTPHPQMTGTVIVQASETGGDEPADDGSADGGSDDGSDSGSAGAESAGSSDGGSSLPATGSETGLLALLGAVFVALGFAIQRRQSA